MADASDWIVAISVCGVCDGMLRGVWLAVSCEKVSLLEENDLVGNDLASSGVCLYVAG